MGDEMLRRRRGNPADQDRVLERGGSGFLKIRGGVKYPNLAAALEVLAANLYGMLMPECVSRTKHVTLAALRSKGKSQFWIEGFANYHPMTTYLEGTPGTLISGLDTTQQRELIEMLVYSYMLEEHDLNPGNWGIAQVNESTHIVRIDPGQSLWSMVSALESSAFHGVGIENVGGFSALAPTQNDVQNFPLLNDAKPDIWPVFEFDANAPVNSNQLSQAIIKIFSTEAGRLNMIYAYYKAFILFQTGLFRYLVRIHLVETGAMKWEDANKVIGHFQYRSMEVVRLLRTNPPVYLTVNLNQKLLQRLQDELPQSVEIYRTHHIDSRLTRDETSAVTREISQWIGWLDQTNIKQPWISNASMTQAENDYAGLVRGLDKTPEQLDVIALVSKISQFFLSILGSVGVDTNEYWLLHKKCFMALSEVGSESGLRQIFADYSFFLLNYGGLATWLLSNHVTYYVRYESLFTAEIFYTLFANFPDLIKGLYARIKKIDENFYNDQIGDEALIVKRPVLTVINAWLEMQKPREAEIIATLALV
tara:strand:- start:17860 stop:19464 length:1605 start_codon:yes stop_codon:yes gene_type:complete